MSAALNAAERSAWLKRLFPSARFEHIHSCRAADKSPRMQIETAGDESSERRIPASLSVINRTSDSIEEPRVRRAA